jgi:hypothetical protein
LGRGQDARATLVLGSDAAATAAALLARLTKKAATPPRTRRIVPNRLAIPQFIPCANGESLWP